MHRKGLMCEPCDCACSKTACSQGSAILKYPHFEQEGPFAAPTQAQIDRNEDASGAPVPSSYGLDDHPLGRPPAAHNELWKRAPAAVFGAGRSAEL